MCRRKQRACGPKKKRMNELFFESPRLCLSESFRERACCTTASVCGADTRRVDVPVHRYLLSQRCGARQCCRFCSQPPRFLPLRACLPAGLENPTPFPFPPTGRSTSAACRDAAAQAPGARGDAASSSMAHPCDGSEQSQGMIKVRVDDEPTTSRERGGATKQNRSSSFRSPVPCWAVRRVAHVRARPKHLKRGMPSVSSHDALKLVVFLFVFFRWLCSTKGKIQLQQ